MVDNHKNSNIVISNEVVLPRRVRPQPMPFFAACGDCSYCCIAGVIDCSVEEAYILTGRMIRDANGVPKCEGTGWTSFTENITKLYYAGYFDRIITEVPIWPGRMIEGYMDWGSPSYGMWIQWSNYVRMAIDAGYYGFCSVIMDPKEKKYHGPVDHKVLICGWRQASIPSFDEEGKLVCSNIKYEILVSCSSRLTSDEEWVSIDTFLKTWGGFQIMLVRPKK